jgi:hypothetical protein
MSFYNKIEPLPKRLSFLSGGGNLPAQPTTSDSCTIPVRKSSRQGDTADSNSQFKKMG